MTPKGDALDESTNLINEIESGLDKTLRQRREEIERDLEDRLRREREETDRKLSLIERDFARERGTLREYKGTIAEFESARDSLEAKIREHLDKSNQYQGEIERLTGQTREELRLVQELSAKLSELRASTESKVNEIRNRLAEKYGTGDARITQEPVPVEGALHPFGEAVPKKGTRPPAAATEDEGREFVIDLESELGKLKRIKELLETDAASPAAAQSAARSSAIPDPSREPSHPPEWGSFEPASEPDSRTDFKMPEINQFIHDFVKHEHNLEPGAASGLEDKGRAKAEEKRPAAIEEANFQAVFDLLEKYRRSEPTDYNGEINFFQNRDHLILDGESLIRAMTHIVTEAKKLFGRLGQASSPKEQFFIKQELINNQEILRKIILRSVRMGERESCRLPHYTEDILNARVLKDVLERLNMDNWSNQEDFTAFENLTQQLKDTFYRRITPPAQYLRSIVQELEG